MIPIAKAIKIVKRETGSLGHESVRLDDAVGRILARDVRADSDMPPFDRSQMDGYAMKAGDTVGAPVDLKLVGESAAGHGWHKTLKAGQAIRIMTGARLPSGADSIQKIELTREANNVVTIQERTEPGKYIVRRGAEIKRGERLFSKGDRIDTKMIASLAAFGYAKVEVFERPRVSILGTGSEIVAIDKKPGRDQIRNSNSVMLKSMCEDVGAAAKILPQTGDDLEKLKKVIDRATEDQANPKSKIQNRKSRILIITGGVSVGKYDLTKLALRELGAEIFFERVRLRPGKPAVFARLNDTLIFGLPGNPVSAAVTFYLFVRTAILTMQSANVIDLPTGFAVLKTQARGAKERDTYLPAMLDTDRYGRLIATPLRWHGSSDFVGFAKADALVFVPRGEILPADSAAQIAYI